MTEPYPHYPGGGCILMHLGREVHPLDRAEAILDAEGLTQAVLGTPHTEQPAHDCPKAG